MKKFLLLASVLIALPGAATAQTVTTYTSRDAYLAALAGPITTIDFNNITSDVLAPTSVGPLTISAAGNFANDVGIEAYNPNPDNIQQDRNVDGTTYLQGDVDGTVITFAFSQSYFGFGTDYTSVSNVGGGALNLNVFGQAYSFAPTDASAFFGIISDTGFNQLAFRGSDGAFGMDNIALGAGVGAVPEPATWAMMLLGFGMVGGSMRSARRRKDKVSVSFA